MYLNKYGEITYQYWQEISKHFLNIQLNEFIIMPDHMHGILRIKDINDFQGCNKNCNFSVGCADLRTLQKNYNFYYNLVKTSKIIDKTKTLLPKFMHGFKSSVIKTINKFKFISSLSRSHPLQNQSLLYLLL